MVKVSLDETIARAARAQEAVDAAVRSDRPSLEVLEALGKSPGAGARRRLSSRERQFLEERASLEQRGESGPDGTTVGGRILESMAPARSEPSPADLEAVEQAARARGEFALADERPVAEAPDAGVLEVPGEQQSPPAGSWQEALARRGFSPATIRAMGGGR